MSRRDKRKTLRHWNILWTILRFSNMFLYYAYASEAEKLNCDTFEWRRHIENIYKRKYFENWFDYYETYSF